MKHELIECICSDEIYVDLNDDPQFRRVKLSELITESKVLVYFPDYMLLVSRSVSSWLISSAGRWISLSNQPSFLFSRHQLINLLDYAIYIRNIGLFVLVLFFLKRTSIHLSFMRGRTKLYR